MKKRPLSITIIGLMFIAAGLAGLAYHAHEFNPRSAQNLWVFLVRLLAILGGVFLLRGRNWARWLLVAWVGFHVALSVLHTPFELLVHGLLFAGLLVFLFRGPAPSYFRCTPTTAQNPKTDA